MDRGGGEEPHLHRECCVVAEVGERDAKQPDTNAATFAERAKQGARAAHNRLFRLDGMDECPLRRTRAKIRVAQLDRDCARDERLFAKIRRDADRESQQFAWTYRVVEEAAGLWVLQTGRRDDMWDDLYAFTLEPQELVDYELANYFVSTHPDSPFTAVVTAQRSTPEARYILRNRVLTTDRGTELATRVLADDAELVRVLAATFGLHVPTGRELRYHDPQA